VARVHRRRVGVDDVQELEERLVLRIESRARRVADDRLNELGISEQLRRNCGV